MKSGITITIVILLLAAAGCGGAKQVKVTYKSDPPGGTLYKMNGEYWGQCPMVLWYDVDKDARKNGYIEAQGLTMRWPDGSEKSSDDLIRIKVDGTDRQVVFVQPKVTANAVDTTIK